MDKKYSYNSTLTLYDNVKIMNRKRQKSGRALYPKKTSGRVFSTNI